MRPRGSEPHLAGVGHPWFYAGWPVLPIRPATAHKTDKTGAYLHAKLKIATQALQLTSLKSIKDVDKDNYAIMKFGLDSSALVRQLV